MGNTQQAGIKNDDHGGSRHQHPQAASVAPDQLQAGVRGDGHGGSHDQQPQATSVAPDRLRGGVNGDDRGGRSRDQQPRVVSVVDPVQFRAGAADRARNQLQPLGGGHDVGATSTLRNGKKNSATDGEGLTSRIDILGPAGESVILGNDELPKPEGVQFVVLQTLPIKSWCIGDGDGFTAYVKKAADVAASGSYKKGDTNNRAPQQYRIRMRGIDAPEMKMEHGVESRNELVKLIGGKCVKIDVYGTDQYGRHLGDIYCDGMFIQEELLKGGFAWYFRAGEERPQFARWEREAKEARRGLWSSDNPQKPWEWKRDHPRNNKKENANDIQVESQSQGNVITESLACMISKDMENLGRQWKKKLENFVADNVEQNYHLQELKRNKKEAEDRAKELEKEMESVVADNVTLNDQLEESKQDKKKADDRILKLTFFSESVVEVNMGLHDKLEKLKERNKRAEDRAMESEKEMESVVLVNRELNDQLQELKGTTKLAEERATELKFSYDSDAAVNMALRYELEELRRRSEEAEERNRESKKEMRSVVAENMKLNGQIQRLNNKVSNNARNHKKKLQSVIAINMDLNNKLQELQKKDEKAVQDRAEESVKETENVVAEELNLQGITTHEKSEEAVETPLTPPAKDYGEKERGVTWRKKTDPAATSQAPPAKDHWESTLSVTAQVE